MQRIKIRKIKAKSIITKTNLPEGDYVINPYVGCMHSCVYCYAQFMKKFTGHKEPWGAFVDIKINAPDLIPENSDKYKNKFITIGSVCDPYQPIERKYQLTKKILKKLVALDPHLDILTKSDLATRDVDLFRQFKDCIISFSFSSLDDGIRKKLEPQASSVDKKIEALEKLHRAKIPTALFISPILPMITNWRKIITKTRNFVDEYWFENLNLYHSIKDGIFKFLKEKNPNLIAGYKKIYSKNSNYWYNEKETIKKFCRDNNINCKIYFHHGE